MPYRFNEFYIPERMMAGIRLYVDHGVPPGGFLTAVLENDLSGAVGHADAENLRNLPAYVTYLYNEVPAACWGSPAKVAAWRGKQSL